MNDEPESFESEFESIADEWRVEVRNEIDEAAALSLCFPLTEVGIHALGRLKQHAQGNPLIFWQWISEKFPQHEHYWKHGLEKAKGSEQLESDDSK
jgi:hypothetical protein